MTLKNTLFNTFYFLLFGFYNIHLKATSPNSSVNDSAADMVFENVKNKYQELCANTKSAYCIYAEIVNGVSVETTNPSPKLTKYDIQITTNNEAINLAYYNHGVIPLREANKSKSKILVIGCGNRAITCNDYMHHHKCSYTADINLGVNP